MSIEARLYLDSALAIMERHFLHRDSVDWVALKTATTRQAGNAQTTVDTYPAIRFALAELRDHHSYLDLSVDLSQREAMRRPQLQKPAEMPRPKAIRPRVYWYPSPFYGRRVVEGAIIPHTPKPIAQLVIPLFGSQTRAELDSFATVVQGTMKDLLSQRPCGWMLDLRGNGGGNMWPMLAGVGPLLGDGDVGGVVYSDGARAGWFYSLGGAGYRDAQGASVNARVTGAPLSRIDSPVAVLIDRGTGSSAEGVALAFRGRPSTRSFGEATAGSSTNTYPFALPDGATIYLVTAVMTDRSGQRFELGVEPDETVVSESTISSIDPVVQHAMRWLQAQSACS